MEDTLIVVAHPEEDSLTHRFAGKLQRALTAQGARSNIVDLTTEGFDPRFTASDHAAFLGRGTVPEDVVLEQKRLNDVKHLFLVFPVYWWSMPALLKGWIDRVFIGGWAFDQPPGGRLEPKLRDLTIHLVPIAGAASGVYQRHGYGASLSAQIEHGIVDYCGAKRGSTAFIYDTDTKSRHALDMEMRELAEELAHLMTRSAAR